MTTRSDVTELKFEEEIERLQTGDHVVFRTIVNSNNQTTILFKRTDQKNRGDKPVFHRETLLDTCSLEKRTDLMTKIAEKIGVRFELFKSNFDRHVFIIR